MKVCLNDNYYEVRFTRFTRVNKKGDPIIGFKNRQVKDTLCTISKIVVDEGKKKIHKGIRSISKATF